ncbi:flavodoxin family protein [Clostridiaceae bacterium M8S5]|nr:flavodoxin family protein [Clostridiaceae bacterium M8S5]
MKTIVINEYTELKGNNGLMESNKFENELRHRYNNLYIIDLSKVKVKHCIGCWSCWWKTPGRCVYKDLNQFYHEYITSDRAVYFAKITKSFVSGNIKNLLDRMIPLYLPYTTYKTGESMHVKRYDKYPDIEFYYDDKFINENERKVFVDYIDRVFYQFYSKVIKIADIKEYESYKLGSEQ